MTSTPDTQAPPANKEITLSVDDSSSNHELSYPQLILLAVTIGVVGGIISLACYYTLNASFFVVWKALPNYLAQQFPLGFHRWQYLLIITTLGGFLVGLSLKVMGEPGEIATVIRDIHDSSRVDPNRNLPMIFSALPSIVAGGSAGPEAPLVQISASFGSWLGDYLKLSSASVKNLTLCGMSAVFGSFFGTPLGGAIFPLELLHRRGLEYYEAFIPVIIASTLSFVVFQTGHGVSVSYQFPPSPDVSLTVMEQAVLLGGVGTLIGLIFIFVFRGIGHLAKYVKKHTILLATFGGIAIGIIAVFLPQTLFFSQNEIAELLDTGSQLSIRLLLLIAFAKIFAIGFTLHSGFRGGFILPLFFIGAVLGTAISLMFPQINPTVAMVCMMAAINVAVTKTPVGTTILLTAITNTSMISVVLVASLIGFISTSWIGLIPSQKSRFFKESLSEISITNDGTELLSDDRSV